MTRKARALQDFLINGCGFSLHQVRKMYKELRKEHPGRLAVGSKRDRKIVENIQTLNQAGMQPHELQSVFTSMVQGLATSPEGLKDRWDWYMSEFKLSTAEVKEMTLKCPFILQYNIDSMVLPATDVFHALGVSFREFQGVIKHAPRVLACCPSTIEAYVKLGVSKDGILHLCYRAPEFLTMSYLNNFRKKLAWFLEVVGIDEKAVINRWLVKYPRVLFGASIGKLQERYDALLMLGFSRDEVKRILKGHPTLLTRSIKDVSDKIELLKSVMKRSLDDVVRHPVYLTRSFDIRISLRLAYMAYKRKSINKYSLRTLFLPNDRVFSYKYAEGSIDEYWKFMDWWTRLGRREMLAYLRLDNEDQVVLGQSGISAQEATMAKYGNIYEPPEHYQGAVNF